MKLDYDQQAKVKKSLEEKWPKPRSCPLCHSDNLRFSDTAFMLTEFDPYNLAKETTELPVIAMICYNCGNVMLLSAIGLGAVKKEVSDGE